MQNPMYLPSISIALYDRALQAAQIGQTCNVIMLCTASMEAFVNEYIEFGRKIIEQKEEHDQEQEAKRKLFLNSEHSFMFGLYPAEKNLINALIKHEDDRKNIFIKINTIKKHCIGDEWKKDHEVYCGYCTLVKLRNALTHPRSKMVRYGENDIPKFLIPFYQQKAINYFNKINQRNSWVEAIDTVEFSKWCIKAFERMMILLLKDMYEAKIEDLPSHRLLTSQNALYYLKSFRFPDDLVQKMLTPL